MQYHIDMITHGTAVDRPGAALARQINNIPESVNNTNNMTSRDSILYFLFRNHPQGFCSYILSFVRSFVSYFIHSFVFWMEVFGTEMIYNSCVFVGSGSSTVV